uniref:Uncharacterized protein n=1 Tax=Fagus sylvatica TaxID=28930 RepID=A0A2N9FP45_FAGSY
MPRDGVRCVPRALRLNVCVRRALCVAMAGCYSAAPPSVLCAGGPVVTGSSG